MAKKYKKSKDTQPLILELKAKRHEARLSLKEAAPLIKAQVATLWRWEHGISVPNGFHIHHIKKWLGYL